MKQDRQGAPYCNSFDRLSLLAKPNCFPFLEGLPPPYTYKEECKAVTPPGQGGALGSFCPKVCVCLLYVCVKFCSRKNILYCKFLSGSTVNYL